MSTVANADERRQHYRRALKNTARGDEPIDRPLGHVEPASEANYGFGAAAAEAADDAASAAELAAAAESAAADAAESAGGGLTVTSVVGAGASVLLPQALSTSAATKALKANLVFIYRYPGNI